MTDPKRLSVGDDLGAALLASARGDQPRALSRARTAAAIGLGVGVGVAVSSVASSAAAGTAKAASASIAPKAITATAGATAKAATALWLKLLAAGVVTVAVAGAVAVKTKPFSHHDDATLAERSQLASPAPQAPGPVDGPRIAPGPAPAPATPDAPIAEMQAPLPSTPAPIANVAPTEPAKPAPRAASPAPATPAAPPAPTPTESPLAQELRSLDDARSALARGDASSALTQLDRHDRAFPSGSLRTEARVLRAEALLARGDRASAKRLASELLARDPSGPYARRLRTIADGP